MIDNDLALAFLLQANNYSKHFLIFTAIKLNKSDYFFIWFFKNDFLIDPIQCFFEFEEPNFAIEKGDQKKLFIEANIENSKQFIVHF